MPHFPQMIPQPSGCHRKSSPAKSRRRAPDLGQNTNGSPTRQSVADVSHDLSHQAGHYRPPRTTDPALRNKTNQQPLRQYTTKDMSARGTFSMSKLQLRPASVPAGADSNLDISTATIQDKGEKIEKPSQQDRKSVV